MPAIDLRPLHWLGLLLLGAAVVAGPARAQDEEFAPFESEAIELDAAWLDELIAPIALYPDDLLGIVLPASTFPLDVVRAARFLDELEDDPSLAPDPEWDDSIVALLNYPEVLRMMNEDLDWTWALGESVLTSQSAVLDAVQRFRSLAYDAGNLRSDDKQIVGYSDSAITIKSASPDVVYIPVYDPEEIVVYQLAPVYHYYPIAYPVYYYPYPVGYGFGIDYFWGVTSYFYLGWSSHYVHVHHHTHRLHPYYLSSYYLYTPYYPRNRVYATTSVGRYDDVWRPSPRRGARPRTITAEGSESLVRTRRTSTVETQPGDLARSRAAADQSASRTSTPRTGTSTRLATSNDGSGTRARQSADNSADDSAGSGAALQARTRSRGAGTTSTRSVENPGSGNGSQARSGSTRLSTSPPTRQAGITRSTPQTRPTTSPAPAPRTSTSSPSTMSSQRSVQPAPPPAPAPAPQTRSSSSSGNFSGVRQGGAQSGGTTRTRQR